jgi:hypothetical protein
LAVDQKTGEFPEGAVMLKEENAVGAKEAENVTFVNCQPTVG